MHNIKFIIILILLSSCKVNVSHKNPDTLPKDVATKPLYSSKKEEDEAFLYQMKNDIIAFAEAFSCKNVSDWKIAPMGSKACGGPLGYIAYPKAVEQDILPKIEQYTKLTSDFNIQYKIISDCAIQPEPTGIRCENGKAKLIENTAEN